MSERFSAALRSNPPPPLKRRRAEDSDSGGSTARSGCGYQGCRRLRKLKNGFCGVRHRNFGMADLYDMCTPGGAHAKQQPSGICKFPGCGSPVWVIDERAGEAHDFCLKRHAMEYVRRVTEKWEVEGRLCKFEPCSDHVYVDERSRKISAYCSDKHGFAAQAAMGKLDGKRKPSAAAEGVSSAPQDAPIVGPSKTDGGMGPTRGDDIGQKNIIPMDSHVLEGFEDEAVRKFCRPRLYPRGDKLKINETTQSIMKKLETILANLRILYSLLPQGDPQQDLQPEMRGYHRQNLNQDILNCLEHLYRHPGDFANADPFGLFHRVENVTDWHPWDRVYGFVPRYFLLCIDSARDIQRSTIEGFGWKQTGRPYRNKSPDDHVMTTYLFYERREKGDSKHGHSGEAVDIYRAFQDDVGRGIHKGSEKRWRLNEHSVPDGNIKKLTGGKLPNQKWIILKMFQNKKGLPVWPPIPLKEEKNALVPGRIIPEGGEPGIITSISSSPPGEGPSPGGGGTQGTTSNETGGSEDLAWQDIVKELSANPLNVPEGTSLSSNVSPVEGLPPGGMMLQRSSYEGTGEWDGSPSCFPDAVVTSGAIENMFENNASVPMEAFPETGSHVEELLFPCSISSGAARVEGLLPGGLTSQGWNFREFDALPFLQDFPQI